MAKKETITTAEAPAEELQQPTASLNIQDLIVVAQIIQLSSTRGAFRAEELEQVGGLYNKLISFLESVGALTRNPPPAEEAPEESNA